MAGHRQPGCPRGRVEVVDGLEQARVAHLHEVLGGLGLLGALLPTPRCGSPELRTGAAAAARVPGCLAGTATVSTRSAHPGGTTPGGVPAGR